jgi:hypothetical protein
MGMQKVELAELNDNPHRDPNAYTYNEQKISSLMESIGDTSFWENLLARKTKDGRIELAYGHHRKQALIRLVAEGLDQYKTININVRRDTELTNEMMLKIFAQENKDEWGEEPRNLCMTVLQLKAHLENLLNASATKDDFMKKVGAAGSLRMDDRSFTRMKNAGIGASTIAQFLGDTWSRQTIQDALSLIEDEEVFKLAQNLPNVTLANRFQKLITKSVEGKGKDKTVTMFDEKVQQKVADRILKNDLTRADVEEALSITNGQTDKDPVAAIEAVITKKKEKTKAAKEAAAAERPAPKEPIDKVLGAMERVLEVVRRERVNLKAADIKRVKKGWSLIEEVLDKEPEEIKPAVVE